MTPIRTMMIMTIVSGLVYNNAWAMERANNLLSIDRIPIEFFSVHNKQEFNQSIPFGDGVATGTRLYWYRITDSTITPADAQTITPADLQRNFDATEKINIFILEEKGYSQDDLQKYAIRAENRFNQRLLQALPINNITNYLQ